MDNRCTDKQTPGFDFTGAPDGPFDSFGGFKFNGFTCKSGGRGKRFDARTVGKSIGGTCHSQKEQSPSFGCGAGGPDKFSLGSIHVKPEFDCDLEFHYDMPDGSSCKHRSPCSKSGTTVKNNQCGGAKNVTIVYPTQPSKPKPTCSIDIHTISFSCGPHQTKPTATVTYPAETQPAETQPTETQPAETQPTETQPAETQPTETQPGETQPGETQPAETQPGETQPTQTYPATQPGETAPPTETQPGETQPTETAPAETQPTETQPGETQPGETQPGETQPGETQPGETYSAGQPTETAPGETQPAQTYSAGQPTETAPGQSQPAQTYPTEVPNTTGPSAPVETLPCPDVVPACLNTFLFSVSCSDNSDTACYCPDTIFVKNIFDCIYAHGQTAEIVTEAVIFFQGICAPHAPSNPAIATGATVTSYVTVTAAPTVVGPIYTTVSIVTTTVAPCTDDAGSVIPSSSTTYVISTAITVPQVGFTTGTGNDVGVVPITAYPTGVPTYSVPAQATAYTTASVPGPAGTGAYTPRPTESGFVPVNAGGRVSAGFGLALAAMGLAAVL